MEFAAVDAVQLETTIDIDDGNPLEELDYQETIETIEITQELPFDNNKDPLDVTTELDAKYEIRSCYIHVERCDKIWETMKLIRELQEPPSDSNDEDYSDDVSSALDSHIDDESNSSSAANPLPYIKYQPVLGNGNTALPNFQFSVKSTRALYQCNTCGRQYSHRKSLREHSERLHNIILPTIRRPPKYKERSDPTKLDENSLETPDDDDSTQESASTISSTPSEEQERLLDAEPQDMEYLTASGKVRQHATCKHCSRVLSDRYYLKVHETLLHGVVSTFVTGTGPQVLRNYVAKAGKIVSCDHCDFMFYGAEKLAEHMQIIHGMPSLAPPESVPAAPEKINGRKQVAMKKTGMAAMKAIKSEEPTKSKAKKSNQQPAKSPQKSPQKSPPKPPPKPPKPTKAASKWPEKPLRTCEGCGKVYHNDTNWKVHLITVHGIIPTVQHHQRKKPLPKSLGIHRCKYCNKSFSYASTLRNHIILQHIREQMSSQKTTKPQKVQKIPTPVCERKASTSSTKSTASSKPLRAPPKLLKIPQEEDVKPVIFSCSYCSSTYCGRQSLHYHMANVHQIYQPHHRKIRPGDMNKPHECQGCPERFWNKKNLAIHHMIFHGIREGSSRPVKHNVARHDMARHHAARQRTTRELTEDKPPALVPLQTFREKDIKCEEDSTAIYKTPKTPVRVKIEPNTEPNTSQPGQTPETPLIQCILCNRHCKKIEKHIIEFHKVRNPDMLMSQCKLSPLSPLTFKREPKLLIKKDPDEPLMKRKRRPLDSMSRKRVMAIPPPHAPYELALRVVTGRRCRMYCCKFCPYIAYGRETTKRHCKTEHPDRPEGPVPMQEDPPEEKYSAVLQRRRSEGQILSRKRRRESLDEREIAMRRISSVSGGELRMTRAVKRLKAELENKCDNCERMFRNAQTLAAHRISCKSRAIESGESNDTRESSDRDSGIGISITIKKKNDSYEIVSRDSSGERSTKRPNVDGYSEVADTRQSLLFGHEHRVIKLEKIDDDNVQVDPEGEEFETVSAVEDPLPGEILSLRDLCKRVLGHTRQVPRVKNCAEVPAMVKITVEKPREQFQCLVCKGLYPSLRSRNTHCWMAHKVSMAQRGMQAPTLRNLCVQTLELNGDKEARKKVWFPCHVCNTIWPTIMSRRAHATKVHDNRKSGNLLC